MKADSFTHIEASEDILIRRAQADPAEFKSLYEKYFSHIYRFLLHRLGDRDVTADVTSQVFLKALQKLPSYEMRGFPFSSWLYRIAVNECNQLYRKTSRSRTVVLEEHHAEMLHEEIFGIDRLTELKEKLPIILGRLDETELHYLQLRFFEERPFKEIAEIMDVSENYAKVKTYRTLEKMKQYFTRK